MKNNQTHRPEIKAEEKRQLRMKQADDDWKLREKARQNKEV